MATLSDEAILISDTHLGLRAARTEHLLDFLKHIECKNLILVGDIFDIWKIRTGWYWPAINNETIRLVLEMARKGTLVGYIPGNHDELFREYREFHFRELMSAGRLFTRPGMAANILSCTATDSTAWRARAVGTGGGVSRGTLPGLS